MRLGVIGTWPTVASQVLLGTPHPLPALGCGDAEHREAFQFLVVFEIRACAHSEACRGPRRAGERCGRPCVAQQYIAIA